MRTAETVLGIIRDRGRRGLPLEDVYRQLFNPELYLRAYGRLYRRDGAMTRGSTPETVDAMSIVKIQAIIDAVRHERYRWTPVRRIYIEKKNSTKKRPLGIPTWSDKLLQEVIRSILEAYYEPQFSSHSHGFRPHRGCHTALSDIEQGWPGTVWFIEGDIKGCFDNIDHAVLLSLLATKIHDGRFLRLIATLLQAGYLEDWRYHTTLSGTPQGGVVSPILANIYLDQLDRFVERDLLPARNCGIERRTNPAYKRTMNLVYARRKARRFTEAAQLKRTAQTLPSRDPTDPDFRRLRYVRYADDFLLGFAGPRDEAEEIKRTLAEFLRDHLKLELSESKTLITHGRTSAARFLGYEISVYHVDAKRTRKRRSINGLIGLKVPEDVITEKCQPYMKHGKPVHRPEMLHNSDFSIVEQFQTVYRGIVQYYQLAANLRSLNKLRWIMETSLTKTLAAKHGISVRQVYRKYKVRAQTPLGMRRVFQVVILRDDGRKPLVAQWGCIPLRRRKDAVLDDCPRRIWNQRTELLERLLADTCELCGSRVRVQVHHIRHLADLQRAGQTKKPTWVKEMAARHRKTLVVCRRCHEDIHAGRPLRHHLNAE